MEKKKYYLLCLIISILGLILLITGILIKNVTYLYSGMIALGIIIIFITPLILLYIKNYEKIKNNEFRKYKEKIKKLNYSKLKISNYPLANIKEEIINYLNINNYSYASSKLYKKKEYDGGGKIDNSHYNMIYLLETLLDAKEEEKKIIKDEKYYNVAFIFIDEFDAFVKEELLIEIKNKMLEDFTSNTSFLNYLPFILINKYENVIYYVKDDFKYISNVSIKMGLNIIRKIIRKKEK